MGDVTRPAEPAPEAAPTIGQRPGGAALARFAAEARRDGKRLVVGAVIGVEGRVYLQRRSPSRALFPGAWDLVGGHAEPGEGVLEALRREVFEETGWRLVDLGPVVELIDWEEGGVARREIDLLVTVAGDLDAPLLELGKHSEGRWLTAAELDVLAAERLALLGSNGPDAWVFRVARRALEQSAA